ncbi:hypothetical protein WMF31_33355 [Sorangium sp. So ce1036]|uniref:hypothetical protein n=1 Tax=Sorangium sp. So ce1036 TaxID=3133328 RepID=UPI003F10C580
MTDEEIDESDDEMSEEEEVLSWISEADMFVAAYVCTLSTAIARGDADLGVDASAWENTMAAVEWAMMEQVGGRLWTSRPITIDDVDRMRRLHAMGSVALAGGERPSELCQLANQCMEMMFGPGWVWMAMDLARRMRDRWMQLVTLRRPQRDNIS